MAMDREQQEQAEEQLSELEKQKKMLKEYLQARIHTLQEARQNSTLSLQLYGEYGAIISELGDLLIVIEGL